MDKRLSDYVICSRSNSLKAVYFYDLSKEIIFTQEYITKFISKLQKILSHKSLNLKLSVQKFKFIFL